MARRTKAEAEQTRVRILEAALKVFSEKGYSKATIVEIAKEIGLTKGAVYWHFKTKADLLAAMVAFGDELMSSSVEGEPPESLVELRESIHQQALAYTTDDQAWNFEFFCNLQIEWSTELLSDIDAKLAGIRKDPIIQFERKLVHLQAIGVLRADMNAHLIALCAAAAWNGSMQMALHGAYNREQFVDVLMTGFDLIIGSQVADCRALK